MKTKNSNSLFNKNSSLFHAQKLVELWLVFFSFLLLRPPQELLRPSKKVQILDSWPESIPKKTRHWVSLVCKKWPVSSVQTHVRFVVARVRVHAKSNLKRACDVLACGSFFGVRLHFCTLFGTKRSDNATFVLKKYSVLECLFLFSNALFCFRTP